MKINVTQARFYFRLSRQGSLAESSVSKGVLQDNTFHNLLEAGVLQRERRGRGKAITIAKPTTYQAFLEKNFPKGDPTAIYTPKNAIESHAQYSNSKVGRGGSDTPIVFLRGNHPVYLNGQTVDLAYYTQHFNLFATVLEHLRTSKLCYVENKSPFLRAEAVISRDYTFIHTYGRIGKNLLKRLTVSEIVVFSDYDYVGLNEYLSCKAYCANTTFYTPPDYESLRERYATPLQKASKGCRQRPSPEVRASKEPMVRQLCEQLATTHQFLEQEALFHHAL